MSREERELPDIDILQRDLLISGVAIVRSNLDQLSDLDGEIERVTTLLKESNSPQTIKELTVALRELTSQRTSLHETATVLYMASLRPLVALQSSSLVSGAVPVEDTGDEPVTEESPDLENSPKMTDLSGLSPEEIELLKRDGLIAEEEQHDDD